MSMEKLKEDIEHEELQLAMKKMKLSFFRVMVVSIFTLTIELLIVILSYLFFKLEGLALFVLIILLINLKRGKK